MQRRQFLSLGLAVTALLSAPALSKPKCDAKRIERIMSRNNGILPPGNYHLNQSVRILSPTFTIRESVFTFPKEMKEPVFILDSVQGSICNCQFLRV